MVPILHSFVMDRFIINIMEYCEKGSLAQFTIRNLSNPMNETVIIN